LHNLTETYEDLKNLEIQIEQKFLGIKKLLEETNKNKNLTPEELDQLALDLFKIKKSIFIKNENSQILNLSDKTKANHLSEIMEEYYKCKTEIAKYTKTQTKHQNIAKALAKILIYLGGIFFIIELYLVYYLTFEVLSWDITEPMTYLLGCFNLILIFRLKKKFRGQDAFQYFTNLFLNIMLRKTKKIDFDKMLKLRKNISDIERFMRR